MISICIPVFNTNVLALVRDLLQQLNNSKIKGEIIVYDDFSDSNCREQNKELFLMTGISYKEMDKNYGRIKIRMLLAKAANYNWILFLDSDSLICGSKFLLNYTQAIKTGGDVFTGGRNYNSHPPEECKKRLHWTYGIRRESPGGKSKALHTNNFCIRKEVFTDLDFPSYLNGYGHEDTWIQLALEKKGIQISHIDNPVLHQGIEDVDQFLDKSMQALLNLLLLARHTDIKSLRKQVPLFNMFCRMKEMGLTPVFLFFYKIWEKTVVRNLRSCKPVLAFYDLFRLNELIKLSQQNAL